MTRDEVSRAVFLEIQKGNKVFLDICHLGDEFISKNLPQEKKLIHIHEHLDPNLDLIPVSPDGKILKSDVVIAKNYLAQNEIKSLDRIVTMYLDYAEDQAERNIPMTMKDWSQKLNSFLQFNERDILQNAGKVTAVIAKEFAISEFEKYKVIQDKSYKSDFDRLLGEIDI